MYPAQARRAIELAQKARGDETLADVLATTYWPMNGPDILDERLATASELARLAADLGEGSLVAQAHYWLSTDLLELDDLDASAAEVAALDRLAEGTSPALPPMAHRDTEEVQALCRAAREGRHRTPLKHDVGEQHKALQARLDAQDATIYTVAAYAGLRLGEIRGLRWRDVDFAKRLIHVRRAFTQNAEDAPKSGKARAVPMIDQVATALDELSRRHRWTGDDDLVFVSPNGGHLEDSALRRRFYAALKAAGIKHLRFHDLRHSFGTLAVQVFPLSDVKAYMGHADIATTMIYVHHVPQHDAAAKLSAAVAQTTARGGLSVDSDRLDAVDP